MGKQFHYLWVAFFTCWHKRKLWPKAAVLGLMLMSQVARGQAPALNRAAAQLPAQARKALYQASFEQYAARLYAQAGLGAKGLTLAVFREGLVGYYNLQAADKSGRRTSETAPVLTLIDFAQPSSRKRLWVINLKEGRVLFHTLVAHGRGTGEVEPVAFS
jgi:hypothetical protein